MRHISGQLVTQHTIHEASKLCMKSLAEEEEFMSHRMKRRLLNH